MGEKDNKSNFTYWQKNKNLTNLSTLTYLSFLSSDAETPERQNIRKARLHIYVYILYMYAFTCWSIYASYTYFYCKIV